MKGDQGKVSLVGAGPGDPELLTIKAMKAIAAADVLLVDDLVADAILTFANKAARIIYVGKRGGCKSTPQAFIEKLMVNEALAGKNVVRLKGGDPYIFGRGGEERCAIEAAGVVCEVVHGITAGLAGPASIGIPLTHRDFCHGAIFVTGHAGEDAVTSPNWTALAATGMPLVIYMGVSRINEIVDGLINGGMASDMPVAVIQNATRADQQAVITTLADTVADIAMSGLGSPAIVVVGKTVSLAKTFVASVTKRSLQRGIDRFLLEPQMNTDKHRYFV
jgi:uroporphyrin-III C-methyltransferase